ncbi:MAG TPA: hypothetical protein VM165_03770 [Planctomycetaceae bacterium]|nr:hypothetical protein [Planctomycetaceae bacterium]
MRPRAHHHHRTIPGSVTGRSPRTVRPAAAYRQRGATGISAEAFAAPEAWHEPQDEPTGARFIAQRAGEGYIHPVTIAEVRDRMAALPKKFADAVDVVQFSTMTRKRRLFPCYGMQWGSNVYLYPIEASLTERYIRPPRPEQLVEAKMFGGVWSEQGREWRLTWTPETIRDFYLNNVLIHEIGHVLDHRNTNPHAREQFAIWFATEYGYRAARGRR